MRAGKLDRVVTIRRPSRTVDEYGVPADALADVATLRAQRIDPGLSEVQRDYGASDETAAVYRTRFLADVALSDVLVEGDEIFNIIEIREIGRRRGLEIKVQRRNAE